MFALASSMPRHVLRDHHGRCVYFDNQYPLCCTAHVLRIRQTFYFCCVYLMKLDYSEGFLNPFVTLLLTQCQITLGNESYTADKLCASMRPTVK